MVVHFSKSQAAGKHNTNRQINMILNTGAIFKKGEQVDVIDMKWLAIRGISSKSRAIILSTEYDTDFKVIYTIQLLCNGKRYRVFGERLGMVKRGHKLTHIFK